MFCRQNGPNRFLLALTLIAFSTTSFAFGAQKRRYTLPTKSTTQKSAPAKKTLNDAGKKPQSKTETKADAKSLPTISTRIDNITRKVDVKNAKDTDWKTAKTQMPLGPSDQIRTGKNSVARVKLADGSKVLLLQNSQAEMENLTSVQKTIKLLRGRVRAVVAKIKGGNNFQIKTPVGVASVRGTDFEVEISEDGKEMAVEVREGQVGVGRLGDLANEVVLNPGERIKFGAEGELGNPIRSGAIPVERDDVRAEIQNTREKESIIAMAAEEQRNADYQVGKSLMDVYGNRVRVEEYITRPAANQFKLVVLNERAERFDYFTYKGTFNQALPEDLSIALKEVGGKLGSTKPDYYLTEYETMLSNTIDHANDSATGGHLVHIGFDGTYYTLTETDPTTGALLSNTRVIEAATLQADGSYNIYNPLRDVTLTNVAAADKDETLKISVLDAMSGSYKNLESGDEYWKTRFNDYASYINDVPKIAYSKKNTVSNTLALDYDANFSNEPITLITEFPSGEGNLHNRLTLMYGDGSVTTYDNYIIDDEGKIAPTSTFDGASTSAAYREELEKWNYQQRMQSDEMGGRYIDLVVDPRIGTVSGLIQ